MAKYNLIFFLDEETIITNEIGTKGGLQTVEVKGFKKYEYKTFEDFALFFKVLKDDICGVSNFSEGDFHATILNKGVSEDAIAAFKEHLADCKEVTVLCAEITKALTENMNDDEIEKLQKKLSEKEDEITSLNEKVEIEKRESIEKISILEDEKNSLSEEYSKLEKKADILTENFITELFPVNKEEGSVSTLVAAKVVEKKFNNGDKVQKDSVIAITEYKGMSFEIIAPNDGYIYYCCKTGVLSIGQKIAFVRKKQYEILEEVCSEYDGVMPILPYHKKIVLDHSHDNFYIKWDKYGCIVIHFRQNITDETSYHHGYKNYVADDIMLKVGDTCFHYESKYDEFERFVIPFFNAGTAIKKEQKIAVIVKNL